MTYRRCRKEFESLGRAHTATYLKTSSHAPISLPTRLIASLILYCAILIGPRCSFDETAAAANLVVGGGFENPVVPQGDEYLLDITPMGWVGTGDIVVQGYSGAVPSGDGEQWFDLNPGTAAGTGISQSVTLKAGTTYEFSFLYNGDGDIGGTTTQIAYSIASGAGTLLSGSVSTAALNVYAGSPWESFSAFFTPSTGGSDTLAFLPNGVYAGGFIDAVNVSPTLPGDVNFDGIVNGQDISLVAGNWLHGGSSVPGDANHDGIVNGQDIALIASNWLQSSGAGSSGSTVPEPASISLAGAAFLGILVVAASRMCRRASAQPSSYRYADEEFAATSG